jgi:hypothetical protein
MTLRNPRESVADDADITALMANNPVKATRYPCPIDIIT